jgi:hypothetical protein
MWRRSSKDANPIEVVFLTRNQGTSAAAAAAASVQNFP